MMKYVNPVIRMFKNLLEPKGTLDVSMLRLNAAAAFNTTFMEQIYKELDKALINANAGIHELSPCQRLVINVLADSANVDTDPAKFNQELQQFIEFEKKKELH